MSIRYVTERSFDAWDKRLGKRDSLKVGNNTYVERRSDDSIGVRLHYTYVVTFYRDGEVEYDTGGFHTVTTKQRMNAFGAPGVRIFQRDFEWYADRCEVFRTGREWPDDYQYRASETVRFRDGMLASEVPPVKVPAAV